MTSIEAFIITSIIVVFSAIIAIIVTNAIFTIARSSIKDIYDDEDDEEGQYTFRRLKSGWGDPEFETKLKNLTDEMSKEGYQYYDIKITSNGDNCLVVFIKE